MEIGIGVNNIGELKLPLSYSDLLQLMHKRYWQKVSKNYKFNL